jgi:citronellol/citronellal dehydrogenase
VTICGRRADPLAETVTLGAPGRVSALEADVREEAQVLRLVDDVVARRGRIDLLVNNAGGQYLSPAESISANGFRAVMRLNVEGTWLMTHAVATRAMIPDGQGGKILSITLSPKHGLPTMAHASAARAAVDNLMRTLSIEWARFGVHLNAIALGPFVTRAFAEKYPRAVVDGTAESVPIGRAGREAEVAQLVAFLASSGGDFFSGSVVTLDGARDNWYGAWPPPGITDSDGEPLAERRKT